MKSQKAKVLHELDGRPIIAHVIRAALSLRPHKIYVVVGHQAAKWKLLSARKSVRKNW
jgi:bifunctional N-acetylglucosamine-1-phosphate-uridyltransferase/glucosamine-1-phosphate-acetyltransferase GlmU-like protein